MGEALGIPEWLAMILFVGVFLAAVGLVAWRNTRRQIRRTKVLRLSPTRDEFLAMMQPDVRPATAKYLWDACLPYLCRTDLTPHPDDDLAADLPIDDDDWSMDWPREFAAKHGFHESNLPDWPDDWPATIRNYGRWLDMALTGGWRAS